MLKLIVLLILCAPLTAQETVEQKIQTAIGAQNQMFIDLLNHNSKHHRDRINELMAKVAQLEHDVKDPVPAPQAHVMQEDTGDTETEGYTPGPVEALVGLALVAAAANGATNAGEKSQ